MLGAIIGDIIGSIHEFAVSPTKSKDFVRVKTRIGE